MERDLIFLHKHSEFYSRLLMSELMMNFSSSLVLTLKFRHLNFHSLRTHVDVCYRVVYVASTMDF